MQILPSPAIDLKIWKALYSRGWSVGCCHIDDSSDVTLAFEVISREETDNTDDTDDTDDTNSKEGTESTEKTESTKSAESTESPESTERTEST